MRQVCSFIVLAMIMAGCAAGLGSAGRLDFWTPKRLTRGQTTEILVGGKALELSAVEFTPPDGITVEGMKQVEASGAGLKSGLKRWAVRAVVAKDASPGERTVTFISTGDRFIPEKIRIQDHAPRISELKIVSSSAGLRVKFEILAFDEAADISPESKPICHALLICGNMVLPLKGKWGLPLKGQVSNIRVNDPKNTRISFEYSDVMLRATGTCNLKVRITDPTGNESNELESTISF